MVVQLLGVADRLWQGMEEVVGGCEMRKKMCGFERF